MTENIDSITNWLEGIPRGDIADLKETSEYKAFIGAFQMLEKAHRKVATSRREVSFNGQSESILQCISDDDVVLRICEFLHCLDLVLLSETCSRFHSLCNLSAKQRTSHMNGKFYLDSYMKLLRAKEQTEGIIPDSVSVRVPLLSLQRRIIVADAGDEDYNGIYHCTGTNGNGFLFSKPRSYQRRRQLAHRNYSDEFIEQGLDAAQRRTRRRIIQEPDGYAGTVNTQGEEIFPDNNPNRHLRCLICKKFSSLTILWYMSKEVETGDGEVKQEFSFWAKLMISGQGTPDICRYPSQTSILQRDGDDAWLPLAQNQTMQPPNVELLD